MRAHVGVLRRGSVALTTIIATLLAGTLSATAQTGAPAPRPPASGGPGGSRWLTLDGVAEGTHTITLVTGDRVRVTVDGGGRTKVEPMAAHRPDGRPGAFLTEGGPEGMFVIPEDAGAAIGSGRLDRDLFNVKYLMENGYADETARQLPVIVQYPAGRSASSIKAAAGALPASTPTRELESIRGAALSVPKAAAGTFWSAVHAGTASPSLSAGLAKIWLDRKVRATLDKSVPLIGAPEAWAAGRDGKDVKVAVLDTGADVNHPDLRDKVEASRSFVPGQEVKDGHGHGTHVAATIAGSGAGSAGNRKGVAPGARLVIGKVLNNGGVGDWSWIIDGMEWAAGNARIVSMSLGGDPSDGTDLVSQTVNNLTASTGALFVIAAGNSGNRGIGTPGAADAALTVAATDKSDNLAGFSSRGPRFGDSALKPDIAAPGVNIVAARAEGTSLCGNSSCGDPKDGPVDELFSSLSGTSMATPHVSGAAAILAQQHPEWKADKLKTALMSTATDAGHTAYQQGAGRVDVGRADRQKVFGVTANLDYRFVPDGQPTRSDQVTYTNAGDQPVTLTLTPTLKTIGGDPAPGGGITADKTVTVPAHGTAAATVTLDPGKLPQGTYTGAVVATDEATKTRVTTPVGLIREPLKVNLTVRSIGPDGAPLYGDFAVTAVDVPGVYGVRGVSTGPGIMKFRVPPGTWNATRIARWLGEDAQDVWGVLSEPEITVTGDTEVTLDARKAVPITYATPKPNETVATTMIFWRSAWDGAEPYTGLLSWGSRRFVATPTRTVTKGTLRLQSHRTLIPPQVRMSVVGGRKPVTLDPVVYGYQDQGMLFGGIASYGYVPFKERQKAGLVHVNYARPDDIAKVDLRGKLALMMLDPYEPPWPGHPAGCRIAIERVRWLREAGAVGVMTYPKQRHAGCSVPSWPAENPLGTPDEKMELPTAQLGYTEGQAVRAMLDKGPVTLDVRGTSSVDYLYHLAYYEEKRIPRSLQYVLRDRDLAAVSTSYHTAEAGAQSLAWSSFAPRQTFSVVAAVGVGAPQTRTEYFAPLSPDILRWGEVDGAGVTGISGTFRAFSTGDRTSEHWNATPATPGAIIMPSGVPDSQWHFGLCAMCRQGEYFFPYYAPISGNGQFNGRGTWSPDVQLFKDGVEVPRTQMPGVRRTAFALPKEKGTYRLVQTGAGNSNTWTFSSSAPAKDATPANYACWGFLVGSKQPCRPDPLVFVGYDLGSGLGLDNTVRAPGPHKFRVRAYHSPSKEAMPRIAGLKLSYSTDDGKSWKRAILVPRGNGAYDAVAFYPEPGKTTGAVSLKAEAWDAAGNRVEQTTARAFNLPAPTHH